MKRTLGNKIILFSFVLLFGTILLDSAIHIAGFRRDYEDALYQHALSVGDTLKANVEKVLSLGVELGSLPGLSEKCQEMVASNPELTHCVITDPSNNALYYNSPEFRQLRFQEPSDRVASSRGNRLAVIDHPSGQLFDTVSPLYAPDGKIVGFIHVGFPSALVTGKVLKIALYSAIVLVFSLAVAFALAIRFVRKNIVRPVNTLLEGVQAITRGDFSTTLPEDVGEYELAALACNINLMSAALKSREEEIQKNYAELAATHQKLQISYLQLEGLSLEVEQSSELYRALMHDSSDAILVLDEQENVAMMNALAEKFFGYTSGETIGLPLTKFLLLLNIEGISRFQEIFRHALAGGHESAEVVFQKKSGERIVANMNASSVSSGEQKVVQAIFRDITREKEILDNLSRSTEELASLNRMKDSFLGLASHELKTPLTVIMGYTELILSDMDTVLDPTVREMVQNISNAGQRLDSIVKDMVDVSMIAENRLQLHLEQIDINKLLEMAAVELKFFISMRQQELVLQLDPTLPAVQADRTRLMQLFSNLLGNAIKFTPDGGRISIATSAKYLSRPESCDANSVTVLPASREPRLYVEIAIHDTGIGIDRDDQMRIFEKFYEAGSISEHSSGKTAFKAKGAGLGLAIAKGVVEVHGGEIWVESSGYDPERFPGSTFHVLLPVDSSPGGSRMGLMNILSS